uniref:Mitochondrial genome maintenance exonuclease 1 n=1 Tax=Sinocyclocheilus grahami TaxID=75366 RepID=A0A672MQI9_SINGR
MQVLKLVIQCKCVRSMGFPSGQFSRVDNFSTSCQWRARKKVSQYSTVDTERYSSLVILIFFIIAFLKHLLIHLCDVLDIFRLGKLLHAAIEDTFTQETSSEEDHECPAEVTGEIESVSNVLNDIAGARLICNHHALFFNTSEKPKPFLRHTYDNPLQVAAYMGALNSDHNYNYQVENGLIVVAYKDGSPAHAHFLNSEQIMPFWEKWLLRLEEYRKKSQNRIK